MNIKIFVGVIVSEEGKITSKTVFGKEFNQELHTFFRDFEAWNRKKFVGDDAVEVELFHSFINNDYPEIEKQITLSSGIKFYVKVN